MKQATAGLLCVLACVAARGVVGSTVAWPAGVNLALSGPLLNAVVPPVSKGFAYSTTQYINAVPATYTLGLRPQFQYQIPQVSSFGSLVGVPSYYPVANAPYFPTGGLIYPSFSPIAPVLPSQPAPRPPNVPEQPAAVAPASPSEKPTGDADTTVIESAEFTPQQQQPQQIPGTDSSTQSQTDTSQGLENVPSYPKEPQVPELPQLPQVPQFPGGYPQFPQFPGGFPQIPQLPGGFPQIPQLPGGISQIPQFPSNQQIPQLPQTPSFPPQPTAPSADNTNQSLNDEDTISVESA